MTPKELFKLQYIHDAYGKHIVKDGFCPKCLCNVRNGKSINLVTSPITMFTTYWPNSAKRDEDPMWTAKYLGVMLAHYCKQRYEDPKEAMDRLNAPDNAALSYYGHKPVAQSLASDAVKIASEILQEE